MKLPREVKAAGNSKPLFVHSLYSHCGDIENGIAFAFEGEGAWVVDLQDLKIIVHSAERFQRSVDKSKA